MAGFFRTVVPRRDGTFSLRLGPQERDVIRRLPAELRELLTDAASDGDPAIGRLFPPAYGADDPQRSVEFANLMRDDLLAHHLGCLEIVDETIDADVLTEDQLVAWMQALNELRLVIGVRIGVEEEMEDPAEDDPIAPAYWLYQFLTALQSDVIDALSGALDA